MFKVTTTSTQLKFHQQTKFTFRGGSVAEWSARRTRNPVHGPGSSHALTTTWIYFTVAPSSNPQPPL